MNQRLPQVIQTRAEVTKLFISDNSDTVHDTEKAVLGVRTLLTLCVAFHEDIGIGARFDAVALLAKADNILISAFSLASQRAYFETMILLRVALETASTAYAITDDANIYNEYSTKGYHFKSTTSIKYAKKAIRIIGEIYGAFSTAVIHQNRNFYGPTVDSDEDGKPSFGIVIGENKPINPELQDWLILHYIGLVANIITRLAELMLLDQIGDNDSHFHIPGSNYEMLMPSKYQIDRYWYMLTHKDTWPSKP